jgi:hypothetical protein
MIKQLMRDALPRLLEVDEGARSELLTFCSRRISRAEEATAVQAVDTKFLASALLGDAPRDWLIGALVEELTSRSLQSVDELIKATKHLGLDPVTVTRQKTQLCGVLHRRNNMIHELDVDFDQPRRNRTTRRRDDMVADANRLLELADEILAAVMRKF